jgi:hypothetical protein
MNSTNRSQHLVRNRALIALCVGLLLPGCYTATTRLDYTAEPINLEKPVPLTLAVPPFEDGRPERAYPGQLAHLFLTYIPLIPYVTIPYERLDDSLLLTKERRGESIEDVERFPTGMARAAAADLRQSGVFREVRDVASAQDIGDADLILTGRLVSTEFDVSSTSYMLGIAGVLLWIVPVPIGANTAVVNADLELHDHAGNLLWTHPLRGRSRKIFTLYNSTGAPVSARLSLEITRFGRNEYGIDGDSLWAYHADALRRGMAEAKTSLAGALAHYRADHRPPIWRARSTAKQDVAHNWTY